jgi:hypothetical protein
MVQGAEDYIRSGDWCMPWLGYGGNQWIWAFGMKITVETRFGKSLLDKSTFCPKFRQKTQVWVFGTDLDRIWPVQMFGYLGILGKNKLWQAPIRFALLQNICAITDFLCNSRFLDLVIFLHRNLPGFCCIRGFLKDSWIVCRILDNCTIAYYLGNCGLYMQLQIISAISQIPCGIEDTCANTYKS